MTMVVTSVFLENSDEEDETEMNQHQTLGVDHSNTFMMFVESYIYNELSYDF